MDISKEYIKMCDREEIQREKYPANELTSSDMLPDERILDKNGDVFMFSPTAYGDLIWLPRQDRLQEMMNNFVMSKNELGLWGLTFHKAGGEFLTISDQKSAEQVLLQGVMKELYNKTWDGNKWI